MPLSKFIRFACRVFFKGLMNRGLVASFICLDEIYEATFLLHGLEFLELTF